MAVELRNPVTGKYILYRSQAAHSADCERYPFDQIPRRIFLDTSVVNALVKHAPQVFEGDSLDPDLDASLAEDVESLMHVFAAGSRAPWELTSSSAMLTELSQTRCAETREALLRYGVEFVDPKNGPDAGYQEDFARRLTGSASLDVLPDPMDRRLLADAIAMEADVFCTRDRSTIISKRALLPRLPLRILTPREWWAHLKPWLGLFC